MTARVVGRARPHTVCLLTSRENLTADRVVLALRKRPVKVLRLDLADFPHRARLDATLDPRGRWRGTVQLGERVVRLEEIGSLWWWHPGKAEPAAPGLGVEEARWAWRETTASVTGVLASLDCLHVNHPSATHAAQSKPAVLALAPHCGLSVPPTWIGNEPAGAVTFARQADEVVGKPVTSPRLATLTQTQAFFTTPVPVCRLDASVATMTHQLQHRVPKAFEVRVTVVGRRLFPVRINAHSAAAREDYRADYDNLSYQSVSVPEEVESGLLTLMKRLELHYASSDFIVDKRGQWQLVDLNPAGQHRWAEAQLPGLDIADALASLLIAPGPPTPVPYG
ncbi:MvdC/MvdD family ATP grasp protein [Streptomyces spectabilis]|uniref:MvdD-like pre-ATP grasp domain-containing protein n=1 Tax=Streptomyces spectabilis TaxID=68270 RepID=A0A7W8B272_STRST|nr:hypothetical protein [Streptomyces spectabilis]MBB5108990.1 hypothetical protein [Streptomyces spectabilis]